MAAAFTPPAQKPIAQKQFFPASDNTTLGLATASELIVEVSMTSVSPVAVTVKHTADFIVPVAFTLATTVCVPVGMLVPRK